VNLTKHTILCQGAAVLVLLHVSYHGFYRDNCTLLVYHWNDLLYFNALQYALISLKKYSYLKTVDHQMICGPPHNSICISREAWSDMSHLQLWVARVDYCRQHRTSSIGRQVDSVLTSREVYRGVTSRKVAWRAVYALHQHREGKTVTRSCGTAAILTKNLELTVISYSVEKDSP